MALSEEEFTDRADEALEDLDEAFARIAPRYPLEADHEGNVLKITFDEPDQTVFVVSPNAPARQIWVSALMKSFKFDWDAERNDWVLHGANETLRSALQRLSQEQLGDDNLRL